MVDELECRSCRNGTARLIACIGTRRLYIHRLYDASSADGLPTQVACGTVTDATLSERGAMAGYPVTVRAPTADESAAMARLYRVRGGLLSDPFILADDEVLPCRFALAAG